MTNDEDCLREAPWPFTSERLKRIMRAMPPPSPAQVAEYDAVFNAPFGRNEHTFDSACEAPTDWSDAFGMIGE